MRKFGKVQIKVLMHLCENGGEANIPLLGAGSSSVIRATFSLESQGIIESVKAEFTGPHGRWKFTKPYMEVVKKVVEA